MTSGRPKHLVTIYLTGSPKPELDCQKLFIRGNNCIRFQRANTLAAAPSDHVEQSVGIQDSVTHIVEALECRNLE